MLVCDCVYIALNIDTKVVTHNTFFGDLTVLFFYLGILSVAELTHSFIPSRWLHNMWSSGCTKICLILTAVSTDLLLEAIFQWTSLCIYLVIFFKEIYVEYIPEGRTAWSKVWAFKISIDNAKLPFMMVVVAYMITSLNTSPWYPKQVY